RAGGHERVDGGELCHRSSLAGGMVGAVTDVEWDPESYLAQMHDEIPGFEELEEAVAAATAEIDALAVLELGTGTGETALRVLAMHPQARWTGIDSSEA